MGTFRVIPKEIKDQILKRIKDGGISVVQAARDAGVHPDTVRNWLTKGVNGVNTEAVENVRLKRELQGAYELLGKVTAELSRLKKKSGYWS